MPDEPKTTDPSCGDGRPSLRQRLADAWRGQRLHDFCSTAVDELGPKVRNALRRDFGGFTKEDAEDCFSGALERFMKRGDPAVENPEAYIWTSARNEAVDLVEERVRAREAHETNAESTPNGVSEHAAVVLIEALAEDVDADTSWAVKVVALAVARLRPALQRVARHLLANGLDYESTLAPTDLGMTAQTFRANKSNAYAALKEIIPVVMAEHGIAPRYQRIVEVFADRHQFATADDEEAE